MSKGKFEERLDVEAITGRPEFKDDDPKRPVMVNRKYVLDVVDEAYKEYPRVSQKWVPTKGTRVDWKTLCLQMEQKIIEFENFGKKWLREDKK